MAKRKPDLSEFAPQRTDVRLIEDDRPQHERPSRSNRQPVELVQKGFRLPAALVKRLALLKASTGRSEQELVAEALESLLHEHGQ